MDGAPAANRGRRQAKVSVARIVTTALGLIDEHGLEALTMRGLADALGVKPVTLYRYLPNKDAILAEVADLLWRELSTVDPETNDWSERFRLRWLNLFELMLRHPRAIPLIARGGAYSATAGSETARMLADLKAAGFPAELAGALVHAASALVVGFAFAHLWQDEGVPRGAAPAGLAPAPPAEVLDYAGRIGPFTIAEFAGSLDLVVEGLAGRLPS